MRIKLDTSIPVGDFCIDPIGQVEIFVTVVFVLAIFNGKVTQPTMTCSVDDSGIAKW